MSLITLFPEILEAGKKEYEELIAGDMRVTSKTGETEELSGRLLQGENGALMKALIERENKARAFKMIYIDPPFFTKTDHDAVLRLEAATKDGKAVTVKHHAYHDTWEEGIGQYLSMLAGRLYLIKDLLAEDGTVWIHLDWHAIHYVRILMDEIFGADHFVNEIIWTYKSGGSSKKHFSRKHDTILVYSKSKQYAFYPLKEKSYNRGLKPYRFKGVEEFQDEIGWYTLVNMKDVWQIDMVGRTSSERTGYATQKPEALLERIIECSTREGDLCGDFFCGSGTFASVAQKMGRKWICCDRGSLAIADTWKRVLLNTEQNMNPGISLEDGGFTSGGTLSAVFDQRIDDEFGQLEMEPEFRVELKSYDWNPGEDDLTGLDDDAAQMVRELSRKNGLQLIRYWTIDYNYDGQVHKPDVLISRDGKGKMETIYRTTASQVDTERVVSVMAVDVLGNRMQCICNN